MFVLTFWSCRKRVDYKDKVNFKVSDVAAWFINSCNIHVNYSKTKGNQEIKIWFFERLYKKFGGETQTFPILQKF